MDDVPPAAGRAVRHRRQGGGSLSRRADQERPYRSRPAAGDPRQRVAGDVDGRRVLAFVRQGGYAEGRRGRGVDLRPFERRPTKKARRSDHLSDRVDPLTRQVRLHPDSNVLVTAAAEASATAIQIATSPARPSRPRRARGEARSRAPARRGRAVSYEEIGELDDIDMAFDPVGGAVFLVHPVAPPPRCSDRDRIRRRAWEPVDPARLVGRNVGIGFYLGRLMGRHSSSRRLRNCSRCGAAVPSGLVAQGPPR